MKSKIIKPTIVIILIIVGIIYLNSTKAKLSHFQKVIKTHNGIQKTDSKYPTIANPMSSQSGVINGDSVRIIKKKQK